VNAASEKAQEIEKRCSELIGNYERTAEKIVPLNYTNFSNCVIKSNKSNRMTYVLITKEVTLINQDPKRRNGVSKSFLMDLKLLTDSAEDNKAQAMELAA